MICYVETECSYEDEIIKYKGFYAGEDESDILSKIKYEFRDELLKFSMEIIAPDYGLMSAEEPTIELIKKLKTEYEKEVIW